MRSALLSALLSLCINLTVGAQQQPLSVCEVLQRRAELMGRIVTIRGEVKAGGHGVYLMAEPSCGFKLTTAGQSWRNIVFLDHPNNTSVLETSHAPFEVDLVSVRRAQREALRQGYQSDQDRIFETFTGLLVSFDKLEQQASPGAPIMKRAGFGAGLDAPAQLLIKTIADVVVIKKPRN